MKKTLTVICLIIVMSMLLSTACFADEGNFDTLADWNLKVAVPEGKTAVLKGNCYYIYAQKPGFIPYVMITTYKYDSADKFISDFTAYMQKQYPDLKVLSDAEEKVIGDKNCTEIDYAYGVSGYEVKDRRVIITLDGITYMFASKEIEERGETVGDMLDNVVAGCVFLNGSGEEPVELPEEHPDLSEENEGAPEKAEDRSEGSEDSKDISVLKLLNAPVGAYVYTQDDGMLKYWIDLTGTVSDDVVLHCWFRSGDLTWYEKLYILEPEMKDIGKSVIEVNRITDLDGKDLTKGFKTLKVRIYSDHVSLVVKRDKKTLAGGGDDNILTGTYVMEPAAVTTSYEFRNESGMLKYWLEPGDTAMELHAMFRSGDPEYYEQTFILDTENAVEDGEYSLLIDKVLTEDGQDVSDWFTALTLTEVQGAYILNVKRDEKTLAGGAEDNILTGTYMFEPKTYLGPEKEGPYSPEELTSWARIRYFTENAYFPLEAAAEENPDDTVTVQLYEYAEAGERPAHRAVYALYTLDAYGNGFDAVTGDSIALCR